jgi:predicted nucleic acid-binding protein
VIRLRVVSDASALIVLNDIDLLDRVAALFEACVIPLAVEREIAPSVRRPAWVTVMPLTRPIPPRIVEASLDPGEAEALSLALEQGLVPDLHPILEALREIGYFMSEALIEYALREVGETTD